MRTGIENVHFLYRRDVALIFEEMIEEGKLDILLIIQTCLRSEIRSAEPIALGTLPSAVEPRSHNKNVENSGVLSLDRLIRVKSAVQVLVIVPAADSHRRALDISQLRQDVAVFPITIVIRMGHRLVPEFDPCAQALLKGVRRFFQAA